MGYLAKAIAAPIKLYNAVADEIAKEIRLRLDDGPAWSSFFGRTGYSGKTVTTQSAMQLATAWACIKLTAQAVSCLPLKLYEKRGSDSREEVDDDLAEILSDSPNADQTALEYWETVVASLLTRGNAYSEKVYLGRSLSALQPLGNCAPHRKSDGTLVYRLNDRGKTEDLPRDKVFHVKGFGQGLSSLDLGMSPIAYGVHSLGTALAAEEAAGKMFGNGLQVSGVLKSDQTLKPEQRAQLQKIMQAYTGSEKAGKLMILEAGLEYQQMTLNPDDAQMLETRRFSVEEICRWFGVPPIIIGHAAQGQTMWGSGVEQILIAWLTLGIDPLCDRIEARIKKQLIRPTGQRRRYAEFNREALLQMDSKSKAEFLSKMVQNALMSRNEARAKLNLPARPGGDSLTAQTNLAPLETLGADTAGQRAQSAFLDWLGVQQNEGDRHVEA
jgi:HK97 family phage portal protein